MGTACGSVVWVVVDFRLVEVVVADSVDKVVLPPAFCSTESELEFL